MEPEVLHNLGLPWPEQCSQDRPCGRWFRHGLTAPRYLRRLPVAYQSVSMMRRAIWRQNEGDFAAEAGLPPTLAHIDVPHAATRGHGRVAEPRHLPAIRPKPTPAAPRR